MRLFQNRVTTVNGSFPHERALRVAIVTGQLSQGGAERQLTALAEGLHHSQEFVPVVFCLSAATEPYGSVLSAAGVEWHFPPVGSRSKLGRLRWLVRKLAEAHYALVYGVLNTGNIYGGAAALIARRPFVGSIRNADASLPASMKMLSGFFCRRADAVIANSSSCVESLRTDLGVTHDRVYAIPNGVFLPEADANARHVMRQNWGILENTCLVGTVANLKAQKRVAFFLQVLAEMRKIGGSAPHFIWIGDGPERDQLDEYLAQLPASLINNVHFPGASLEVANCLAAFDVFILTSAYEGMPGALLEAMAAGLPCVVTDVPGSRDVLGAASEGEIGLLADANDPARFATTLVELLQNTDRMRQMGDYARRYVRAKYGIDTMVGKFSDVFRDVIDQEGPKHSDD